MSDIITNNGRFVMRLNFLVLSIFFICLSAATQAAEKMNIRGERYCEIIITESITNYAVYNTFGLNDCPDETWNRITVNEIKKEAKTSFVHLNGPRYWVIDGLKHSTLINSTPRMLGGLMLREAGVLHLSPVELIKAKMRSNTYYQQWKVKRKTLWIYEAGKPIYELVDPEGHVYVMQSYSIQKIPQNEESLASLGTKLTLPSGWHFKTGISQQQESLLAINNEAFVVQDDFLNTYQLATHDFLPK